MLDRVTSSELSLDYEQLIIFPSKLIPCVNHARDEPVTIGGY